MNVASAKVNLVYTILVGLVVGFLLGFIDTYGYAVTGYTTAELSPIVSVILTYPLLSKILRRKPFIVEHLISVIIASGISLTTTITSGMYITYTMLSRIADPKLIGLPEWLYMSSLDVNVYALIFYMYAVLVSAVGVVIAYIFHRHFIEKERLAYPIGLAYSMLIQVSRAFRKLNIILPIVVGITLHLIAFTYGTSIFDLTPILQKILPGSSLALTLDIFIFFLALLIPLNTSLGIGLGNLIMYLIITPTLVSLGLMSILPFMKSSDIALEASPYTASIMVGFITIAIIYYFLTSRSAFILTFKLLIRNTHLLKRLILALALITSSFILIFTLIEPPLTFMLIMPFYLSIHLLLILLTLRVVGETGTASQATLPLATFTLFMSGARGALTYALLDPYTGVPMPQFMAGSSMNIIKGAKRLGLEPNVTVNLLILSLLIGAPITFIYGHYLLLAYGLNSPKLNLLRWIPIVMWMKSIYLRDITSFNTTSIIIGALMTLSLIAILTYVVLVGISIYSFLLGITLTPDVGIVFLIASLIKYLFYRLGVDAYEALLMYSSLMLAGSGIGVGITTITTLLGVT